MNVLILGNGGEERAWAEWLFASQKHRLVARLSRLLGIVAGRRSHRE